MLTATRNGIPDRGVLRKFRLSKSKPNKWVYTCPKCQREVVAYVELTEAVCANHWLAKPVYMKLTGEPGQRPLD